MLSDKKLRFQQDGTQAITGDAASDDYIDLGTAQYDAGLGEPVVVATTILTTFTTAAGATYLKIAVQGDTASNFATAVELGSRTVLLADLLKGKVYNINVNPGKYQYLRVNYTRDNNFNAGALVSDLIWGSTPQDRMYPDAAGRTWA